MLSNIDTFIFVHDLSITGYIVYKIMLSLSYFLNSCLVFSSYNGQYFMLPFSRYTLRYTVNCFIFVSTNFHHIGKKEYFVNM